MALQGADGTIVFTITSNGYKDFTHNLWTNIRQRQFPWSLRILCLDSASYEYFSNIGATDLVYFSSSTGAAQQRPAIFGSSAFKQLVAKKISALNDLSRQCRRLIYLDSDIYLYKDPIPRLLELLGENPLWFQCDEGAVGECGGGGRNRCPNACTGLIAIDCERVRTAELFELERSTWLQAQTDQDYLNERMRKLSIEFKTLPRTEFPNGVWRRSLPADAYLLHFNYLLGNVKQQVMREAGAWIL